MLVEYNGTSVSLPDFFIVGAPRCGTSTLYSYLSAHPRIFMPIEKEPMFFSCWKREPIMDILPPRRPIQWAVREPDDYLAMFQPEREGQILGESSTWYLSDHEHVLSNMSALYGERLREVKIIIALRNPADRAWSQYLQKKGERRENMDFESAIAPDITASRREENLSLSYDYIAFSKYSSGVGAYLDRFDKVQVIIFEEFFPRVGENILSVFDFLGVSQGEKRVARRKDNVSGLPRGKMGEAALDLVYRPNALKSAVKLFLPRRLRSPAKYRIKSAFLKRTTLNPDLRQRLLEGCRADIVQLERLLGRDLSLWFKKDVRQEQGART
ncbi:MAG: sulfotransferase domain-containing protein [Candidatus Aminicenantaceae bacterium]